MRFVALFLLVVSAFAGPVLAQGPDSTSAQQKERGKVTSGAGTTSATTTGSSGPTEAGKGKTDSKDPKSGSPRQQNQNCDRIADISARVRCQADAAK